VESYVSRFSGKGPKIGKAFAHGILRRRLPTSQDDIYRITRLQIETVESNITSFLRERNNVLTIRLEDIENGFKEMYRRLGAVGDVARANKELKTIHNARKR
jgi:hypothetical protein